MANIIMLNTPTKADYYGHFVDRFLADRAAGQQADQAAADRQAQEAFRQKQFDQTASYQQGQLTNQQNTFKAGQEDKEIESFVKTAIEPYMSSGRPEDMAKAQANVQQVLADHPDWKGRLIGYALRAGGGQLPADQANANVGKFTADQTGVAASGGTDPNAVNFTTHKALGSFMPKEGFTQQQATDLATRQPAPSGPTALTNPVPKPSGAPVTDYEARQTGALPTAPENLTAQTSITTTGMQQAGETKRTGMKIAADQAKNTIDTSTARDVKVTQSGKQYADIGSYSGKTKDQLIAHYREQGIPAVDKADAEVLREVDNARMNQKAILQSIEDVLPKDAAGRVIVGPENRLSQFFQTNDQLGAFGAYRAAAIQSLRAMAGAKGLRINQAEIKMAVDNDIPKPTDTVGVAREKLKNIGTLLDNAETATLGTSAKKQPPQVIGQPSDAAANFLKKHGY